MRGQVERKMRQTYVTREFDATPKVPISCPVFVGFDSQGGLGYNPSIMDEHNPRTFDDMDKELKELTEPVPVILTDVPEETPLEVLNRQQRELDEFLGKSKPRPQRRRAPKSQSRQWHSLPGHRGR